MVNGEISCIACGLVGWDEYGFVGVVVGVGAVDDMISRMFYGKQGNDGLLLEMIGNFFLSIIDIDNVEYYLCT